MALFHVSDQARIECFEPRASRSGEWLVWAVNEHRLCNYLLPRDCPRVTYFAAADSSADDIARFGATPAGTAVAEIDWLVRILTTRLFVYRLPEDGFEREDKTAGYFVNRSPVVPLSCTAVTDLPTAIAARGAALILRRSLWRLHDTVAASSLGFSMIRMGNAQPR